MDVLTAMLHGVVLPGAMALAMGAVALLASRPAFIGLGVVGAFVLATLLIVGWAGFPPVSATEWAPVWALVAAVLACVPAVSRPGRLRVAAWLALAVPLAWTLTASQSAPLLTVGVVAASVATSWAFHRGLARREPQAGAVGAATLFGLLAVAAMMSGTASLAQTTGGAAAGIGALFVLGLWRSAGANLAPAALPLAVIYVAQLGAAALYAEMPTATVVLLAAAPLALAFTPTLASARLSARWAAPAVGVILTAGVGAGIAAGTYFAEPDPATDAAAPPAPGTDAGHDDDYGYD